MTNFPDSVLGQILNHKKALLLVEGTTFDLGELTLEVNHTAVARFLLQRLLLYTDVGMQNVLRVELDTGVDLGVGAGTGAGVGSGAGTGTDTGQEEGTGSEHWTGTWTEAGKGTFDFMLAKPPGLMPIDIGQIQRRITASPARHSAYMQTVVADCVRKWQALVKQRKELGG
mmetsp:Transcript_37575/g.83382  ORF Transcript_37575/g.83382 Transcript_37575/m.83382 type:complete len:171 (-) Transcript_37575:2-514(-)